MQQELATIFLKFTHDIFIIPILVLGYIWINRKLFYHAICVTLLAVIYARALKNYFQIYSPKYGLIFPSGHILTATATYGWISLKSNKILIWIISIILISLSSYSMIFFSFHNLKEIIGGIFFAIILVISYNYMLTKHPSILKLTLLPLAIALLLYIKYKKQVFFGFIWMTIYALFGIFIGENYFKENATKKREKLLATLLYIFINFITYMFFKELNLPVYIFELRWFIFGLSLPLSINFAKRIINIYS